MKREGDADSGIGALSTRKLGSERDRDEIKRN
jgi:hypothetical protein